MGTRHVDRLSAGDAVSRQVSGRGPPLVCVHGAGVSSRLLLPFLTRMEGVRETWAVDLPGFGPSSGRDRAPTLPLLGDSLLEWIAARGLRGPCLVGMSFGCQIAVEAVLRRLGPEPPAADPEPEWSLVLIGPTLDPRARTPLRAFGRWLRNSPGERAGMLVPTLADYRDAGPRRILAAFAASMHDRVEDKLPHVPVPALVVRGGLDRMAPQSWAEETARLLPRGRLRVVEGAPHTVSYHSPARLARIVDAFMEGPR